MKNFNRLKNICIARLANSVPAFTKFLTASYTPLKSEDIPWTAIKKPLNESKIALVTTAGVHHRGQKPFNMKDSTGDSTYRLIDAETIAEDYLITHDYYDHRDADRDLNVVFPITRLQEMTATGIVGGVARYHAGFMGHIREAHLGSLMEKYAPEVAERFVSDHVDAVLLTPG